MKKTIIKSPKDRSLLIDEDLELLISKLEQILQNVNSVSTQRYSFPHDQTGVVYTINYNEDSIGIIFETGALPYIDKYFNKIRERYIAAGYKDVVKDIGNVMDYIITNTIIQFYF